MTDYAYIVDPVLDETFGTAQKGATRPGTALHAVIPAYGLPYEWLADALSVKEVRVEAKMAWGSLCAMYRDDDDTQAREAV